MTNKAIIWLNTNVPNVKVVDTTYTMIKYEFPDFVHEYIKDNWIQLNNKNGGTYVEPRYFESNKLQLLKFHCGEDEL